MTNHELALRIALAALLKKYEWVCDIYCMKPHTHPEYNQAKRLLDEPL
jgi:hypothetical protein